MTFTTYQLDLAEARSWGRAKGVLDKDHHLSVTDADELLVNWNHLWSSQEKTWFSILLTDLNFHTLLRHILKRNWAGVFDEITPRDRYVTQGYTLPELGKPATNYAHAYQLNDDLA